MSKSVYDFYLTGGRILTVELEDFQVFYDDYGQLDRLIWTVDSSDMLYIDPASIVSIVKKKDIVPSSFKTKINTSEVVI